MRIAPALLHLLLMIAPAAAQDASPPVPEPRPTEAERKADAVQPPATWPAWIPKTELAAKPKAGAAPVKPATPAAPAEAAKPAAPAETPIAPLPRPRPNPPEKAKPATDTPAAPKPDSAAAPTEPAEPPEPRIYQSACPAVLLGQVEAKALPPIHEADQCGLQSPLSVTGVLVNGRMVPLSSAATLSCAMATALPGWIASVDNYLKAHEKTALAGVVVSTSYMCRNVDNAATGNLSFHAFADALDVIGFKLEDGRNVDLESAWRGTPEQGTDIWHFAHDAACTAFTTVLGPDADSFHQNNLHVDLGCHGKTCTARLCQ